MLRKVEGSGLTVRMLGVYVDLPGMLVFINQEEGGSTLPCYLQTTAGAPYQDTMEAEAEAMLKRLYEQGTKFPFAELLLPNGRLFCPCGMSSEDWLDSGFLPKGDEGPLGASYQQNLTSALLGRYDSPTDYPEAFKVLDLGK